MADIIVAFPKLEDAKNMRKILLQNEYDVSFVCDSGAQIVSAVNELDSGVVICGYRFRDMYFSEVYDYLPKGFQMLLLASPARLQECDIQDIVSLPLPVRGHDLLETLEMMTAQFRMRQSRRQKKRPGKRSESERRTIQTAKDLLMERNHMTEEEAHRYLQKISMDSATKLVETAEMILDLNGKDWNL